MATPKRQVIEEYVSALCRHWGWIIGGWAFGGGQVLANEVKAFPTLSWWVWGIVGTMVAQIRAWNDIRVERDALQAAVGGTASETPRDRLQGIRAEALFIEDELAAAGDGESTKVDDWEHRAAIELRQLNGDLAVEFVGQWKRTDLGPQPDVTGIDKRTIRLFRGAYVLGEILTETSQSDPTKDEERTLRLSRLYLSAVVLKVLENNHSIGTDEWIAEFEAWAPKVAAEFPHASLQIPARLHDNPSKYTPDQRQTHFAGVVDQVSVPLRKAFRESL